MIFKAWKPTSACDLATPRASKDFPISISLVYDHLYPHAFLFVCIDSGSGKVALLKHLCQSREFSKWIHIPYFKTM